MTTSTRNRLLVVGLALVVVAIIVLFTILGGEENGETPADSTPEVTENGLGISEPVDAPATPQGLEPDIPVSAAPEGRTASAQIAELFSERYGSYSNQGSYQNLRDLLSVMTPSYRASTEAFLASVSSDPTAETYEGYTATKVATEEIRFDDARGEAIYEISLQQTKTLGTSVPEISYPVLRISLEKTGDSWRVAGATWVR